MVVVAQSMAQEKSKHLAARVDTFGLRVAAMRATARPRVARPVKTPMLGIPAGL